ncbi:MAG: S46 family peptidase [Alistipes sp.]
MKKLFLCVMTVIWSLSTYADEGMWLLPYLQKMNIGDMQAKGCKLSADDIYSLNHAALRDAVVIFGAGCTGEIVSPKGLVFTNHHCGFEAIQSLSSVDHDYLRDGFWAKSNAEEIPAPGLEVRFIRQIVDVTADVLANVPNIISESERAQIVDKNIQALMQKFSEQHPAREIKVFPFFGNNQYFAFVIEVFTDVRLVGTPPTSIGKFGGDTDNWMWPRHTGDFAIFRVYANGENKPAAYSPTNRPYKAEKHLKISLDGYKEGDFAMIMGFPGRTQRYMTSYEIDQMLDVTNPQRVLIRGERQDIQKADMAASDRVRIQYAAKYAKSSNYWKNAIGMSRGIIKLNVKAKKQAQEAAFQKWADTQTLPEEGFIDALPKIKAAVEVLTPIMGTYQYLDEAIWCSVEVLNPAMILSGLKDSLNAEERVNLKQYLTSFYRDFNEATDRKIAKRMLHLVRTNVKALPAIFTEVIDKEFGGNTDAYVDYLYDHTLATNEQKMNEFIDNYSKKYATTDPAAVLATSIFKTLNELIQSPEMVAAKRDLDEGQRLYIAGLMRMYPDKAWAADANSTLRLTYGQVLPYDPADGITYNYATTLGGVIAKEDETNPEFTVPDRLKELYAASDYGRYADADGKLHVAFLANCDITGGNSGSPILNARGELIGLAFDGNWDAMSGDVAFEPDLQRTISVDVRYVLFVVDKFAGAGWLLDEMDLVQQPVKKARRR